VIDVGEKLIAVVARERLIGQGYTHAEAHDASMFSQIYKRKYRITMSRATRYQ
jgi:hypothetical protein